MLDRAKCQQYAGAMPSQIVLPVDIASLQAALQGPLAFVAEPEKRAVVQGYLDSIDVFLERAVIDLLASLSGAVNASENELTARVEYRPEGPCFVIEVQQQEPATEQAATFVEGDLEKITIRVPRDLKSMIDRLASGEGVSANSWYIRELARSLHRFGRDEAQAEARGRRRGNRSSLRGFVGSD